MARGTPKDSPNPSPDPCCCPPQVLVWVDTRTSCIFVENKIIEGRHLGVRSDVGQTFTGTTPPASMQSGHSDSQVDTSTTKNQGKVYRTDIYTINWRVEAQCKPLAVQLTLDGEIKFTTDKCLPAEGQVTLSRAYMLEPPAYAPPGQGFLSATIEATDCAHQALSRTAQVPRP